ncbi:MAG TPA: preprotein translocase subunit YajC [Sediminispirochaeta sp.]|nr:preprotein translocase subunit YajC [Sediminispirochaeta sp.]
MIQLLANASILMGAPQSGAAGGSASGQMMTTFVTFGLVILIFYFLIIRPQNKKQKEAQKMIAALKKGDKVATIGGVRGTITSVKESTVVIKVDDNAKIEFSKNAVATVIDKKKEKETSQDSDEESSDTEDKE